MRGFLTVLFIFYGGLLALCGIKFGTPQWCWLDGTVAVMYTIAYWRERSNHE